MLKTALVSLTAGALVAGSASASLTTIIDEDFESYTDTADLGVTWSLSDGTLDTAFGNPGQSLSHPGTSGSFTGGNTNSLGFATINPTAANPLNLSGQIFDDGTSANERNTIGLRAAAGANIIELGHYNGPSHYAYRVVLFASGNPSWVAFDGIVDDAGESIANAPVEGWHTYTAVVTDTEVTLSLDLNSDGIINATSVVAATPTAGGFDIVRLGGPSDLSSAGGGVSFDNISLTTGIAPVIPEPASLALLGLGGLAAFARRRRA